MDLAIDMDVFDFEEEQQQQQVVIPQDILARRRDKFEELTESAFRRHTRFSKDNFARILDILEEGLQVQLRVGGSPELSPSQKLFLGLSAFASTTFQRTQGEVGGVSQSTAWKYINQVAKLIYERKGDFIHAPNR